MSKDPEKRDYGPRMGGEGDVCAVVVCRDIIKQLLQAVLDMGSFACTRFLGYSTCP